MTGQSGQGALRRPGGSAPLFPYPYFEELWSIEAVKKFKKLSEVRLMDRKNEEGFGSFLVSFVTEMLNLFGNYVAFTVFAG